MTTARGRLARWNVTVEHALYSAQGNWYHALRRFPAAYVDAHGYIVFETEAAYRSCATLKIGRKGDVGVRPGIRSIPGYVRVEGQSETPDEVAAGQTKTMP